MGPRSALNMEMFPRPANLQDQMLLDLVRAAQEGSSQAYSRLVRHFHRAASAIAFAKAGDRETAEDVLQEAWLSAYQKIETLKSPDRFWPWFAIIVSNLSRDRSRRRRTEQAALTKVRTSSEVTSQLSDTNELILRVVSSLTEEGRRLIILRFMGRFSYAEIADMLGLSLNHVKWGIQVAFQTIRLKMKDCL